MSGFAGQKRTFGKADANVCWWHKTDMTVPASSYGRQVGEPLTQRSLT
jgi:hypothetical protein